MFSHCDINRLMMNPEVVMLIRRLGSHNFMMNNLHRGFQSYSPFPPNRIIEAPKPQIMKEVVPKAPVIEIDCEEKIATVVPVPALSMKSESQNEILNQHSKLIRKTEKSANFMTSKATPSHPIEESPQIKLGGGNELYLDRLKKRKIKQNLYIEGSKVDKSKYDRFYEEVKNINPSITHEEALLLLRSHNFDMDLTIYSILNESKEYLAVWKEEVTQLRSKKYKIKKFTKI
eukprot:TRINITY_DN4960_c0_g1_i2.p1 TRINITY_DN4960_c0_g1~~TRINITY_DN4960_c0_g1_i2.p1  ORF type:complete len:231 (-),score=23.53 TRINITY_DN4960_c0_g1_i2:109-801(-)